MRKTYVYKLTRLDGKEYIGITVRLKTRISCHYRSNRFKEGIKRFSVLAVCDDYEEAEMLEERFIEQYDTYYNGLNESINGKGNHLSPNFTTKGLVYSDESRRKMSENHWSKTGVYWPEGLTHSEKTKQEWSKKRMGVCWGNRKISRDDYMKIYSAYANDDIEFDKEFVIRFVKKTQREPFLNGEIEMAELKSPNGKPLTKITLYANWYSQIYNTTAAAIRQVIIKEGISSEDCK